MRTPRSIPARIALAASLLAAPTLAGPVAADADAAARQPTTTSHERSTAARIAQSRVGSPYRWGATGPRSFDCSGLVTWAYRKAGHRLQGRTSYELHRRGMRVPRSRLRRGDLVYTWDRGLGHVGIYLGRGRYVHAPGSGRRVQVAPVPGGGGFVGAVRP
jgi:cell wall-associated NlpC family hydrolase